MDRAARDSRGDKQEVVSLKTEMNPMSANHGKVGPPGGIYGAVLSPCARWKFSEGPIPFFERQYECDESGLFPQNLCMAPGCLQNPNLTHCQVQLHCDAKGRARAPGSGRPVWVAYVGALPTFSKLQFT